MSKSKPTVIECPVCGSRYSEVKDSRGAGDSKTIRRRRLCSNGHRFTTHEKVSAEYSVKTSRRNLLYARMTVAIAELRKLDKEEVWIEEEEV